MCPDYQFTALPVHCCVMHQSPTHEAVELGEEGKGGGYRPIVMSVKVLQCLHQPAAGLDIKKYSSNSSQQSWSTGRVLAACHQGGEISSKHRQV